MNSLGQDFGRVPEETIALFRGIVTAVRERVVSALPWNIDPSLEAVTTRMILSTVFRDVRENENTTGLLDEDIDDLRSFVEVAASLAGGDLRDQGRSVYEAVLEALLEDWLRNWDGGPPVRG